MWSKEQLWPSLRQQFLLRFLIKVYMCAVRFWNKVNSSYLSEQELGIWRRETYCIRVLSKLRFRGKHLPMYSKRIVARVVNEGKKWAYFEHTLEVGQ